MAFTSLASQYIYLNGQLLSASGGVIYINGVQIPTGFASSTIPADVVRTSGTQTIAGDKTFSNQIISSSIKAAGNDSFISLVDNALIGPFGSPSLNWGGYYLVDTDENPSLTWGDGVAIYGSSFDSIATPVVDFTSGQRVFWDGEGIKAADLGSYFFDDGDTLYLRRLYNVAGELTVDWANGVRIFKEGGGIIADFVTANGPTLYDTLGNLNVHIGFRTLSGLWTTNGVPASPGHIVNRGYMEGTVVMQTGDQAINGIKTFNQEVKVYQITNQLGNGVMIDNEAADLFGNWSTYFTPEFSGHIVNKGYLQDRASIIIRSPKVNLKTTASYSIPDSNSSERYFHVDSWELVVTNFSGITAITGSGMPVLSFGDSQSNYTGFLQNFRCSGSGIGARVIFSNPQNGTTGTLGFKVENAASGVAGSYMSGFCVYKGYFASY
jgi:hypothetical protein